MLRHNRIPSRLRRVRHWQRQITTNPPSASSSAAPRTTDHDEDADLDFDLDYNFNTNLSPTEDGTRTLRTRQSGRTLPISPILDPSLIAAKNVHKQTKADPPTSLEDLTPLQQELRRNPYAQALATVVRQDVITNAFLPKHFLQSFGTVFRQPPRSTESEPQGPNPKPVPHLIPTSTAQVGQKTYVLNSYAAIARLSTKSLWQKLLKPETMEWLGYKERKAWVWDKEMADIILEQLKKTIVSQLKRVLSRSGKTANGVMVMDRQDIAETDTIKGTFGYGDGLAAVLLFTSLSEQNFEGLRKKCSECDVYDLSTMLDPDKATQTKLGTLFEEAQMLGLSLAGKDSAQRQQIRMLVASLSRLSMYTKDMHEQDAESVNRDVNRSRREGGPEGLFKRVDLGDREVQ